MGEIDELKRQVAQLQADNAALHAENARLSDELGTQQAFAKTFMGGDLYERFCAAVRPLQLEATTAKQQFQDLCIGIVDCLRALLNVSQQHNDNSTKVAEQEMERAREQFSRSDPPKLIKWLVNVVYGVIEDSARPRLENAQNIINREISEADAVHSISVAMPYMIDMAYMRGARDCTVRFLSLIRGLANDPYIVCSDITDELRDNGAVRIETVMRLDMDWIKANIDGSLGKHVTLCSRLNAVAAYMRGQESVGYAHDTILQYTPQYNKVLKLAASAPDDWKGGWSDVLNKS